MSHRIDNLLRAVSAHPWAITETKLNQIREFLNFRIAGGVLTAAEVSAATSAARTPARDTGRRGAVAVLPIYGTITLRSVPMSDEGSTTLAISRSLDALLADDSVDTILLDIDSPGGTVDGVPELAAKIMAARSQKKIVAIANTMAASAAYWLATAAEELVVSPSGTVGSVGVYMVHVDYSEQNKAMGVNPTYISYGDHKVDGNFDAPLSPEALAHYKAEVEKVGESFVKSVAKQMGLTPDTVRKSFGGGRVVQAEEAVERGMAHRVASYDETLERLVSSRKRAPAGRRADVLRRQMALED